MLVKISHTQGNHQLMPHFLGQWWVPHHQMKPADVRGSHMATHKNIETRIQASAWIHVDMELLRLQEVHASLRALKKPSFKSNHLFTGLKQAISPLQISVSSARTWRVFRTLGQNLNILGLPSKRDILTPCWSLGFLTPTASLRSSILFLCWGRNGINKQNHQELLMCAHKARTQEQENTESRWKVKLFCWNDVRGRNTGPQGGGELC